MENQRVFEGAEMMPPLPAASVKEKFVAGGIPLALIELICATHGGISVPSLVIGGAVGYISWRGYPLIVKEHVDKLVQFYREALEEKERKKVSSADQLETFDEKLEADLTKDNFEEDDDDDEQALIDRYMTESLGEAEKIMTGARPKDARREEYTPLPEVNDIPAPVVRSRRNINLAPDLSLPISEVAGKAILVTGMRRSGKTTFGALLAEQLGKLYIPLLIPDYEGDYLSLPDVLPRGVIAGHSSAAGKYAGYQFIEVTHKNGAEWGYSILDQGYQIVLDLASYPSLNEGYATVIQMIKGLFLWSETHPEERTTAQVYLDEAQRYLPQTLSESMISDRKVLLDLFQMYKDLLAVGGKRGLSPVILTQRLAQTNNAIFAQSEIQVIMRQTHDSDLERCMKFVKKATANEAKISVLKKGEGIYIAYDGSQTIHQFDNRVSDGSRGKTPDPEKALRYAEIPFIVRSAIGSVSPELPNASRMPNPRAENALPATSPEVPQGVLNELVEATECAPEDFRAQGDDLLLSELQAELLLAYYRHCGNINKSLEQIKNERGQGLGGRYFRHASYILEQHGLKKKKGQS